MQTVDNVLNARMELHRANEELERDFERVTGEKLSAVRILALTALYHGAPMNVTQLRELLDVSNSALTYLMNRMEFDGLIQRERGKDDRRQVLTYLTPYASNLMQKFFGSEVMQNG